MNDILLWLVAQFTASLVAFGYQIRRLQDLEKDIEVTRSVQSRCETHCAVTYVRRDVLTETLTSINTRLGHIETDLRELKRQHEGRD